MDVERLQWALRDALVAVAAQTDPDDLDDIIDFLATECASAGLQLNLGSSDNEAASERIESHGRTLEDLLAHPLTAVLGPHLVDLLHVEEGQVAILVDNVLDAYVDGTRILARLLRLLRRSDASCPHRSGGNARGALLQERRGQAM